MNEPISNPATESAAAPGVAARHHAPPKPLWHQSRWTAFVIAVLATIGAIALHAPTTVLEHLATMLEVALPTLVAGESVRRMVSDPRGGSLPATLRALVPGAKDGAQ